MESFTLAKSCCGFRCGRKVRGWLAPTRTRGEGRQPTWSDKDSRKEDFPHSKGGGRLALGDKVRRTANGGKEELATARIGNWEVFNEM